MNIHAGMSQQGLVRPVEGRVIGGVCAGLARRIGLGPWGTRLLFVLALMAVPGSQILIYPILWILMPSEQASWPPVHYSQPSGSAGQQPV